MGYDRPIVQAVLMSFCHDLYVYLLSVLGEVCIRVKWLIRLETDPGFRSMKRLEGISTSPSAWMGCPSIAVLIPALSLPVPICTPRRGEAL